MRNFWIWGFWDVVSWILYIRNLWICICGFVFVVLGCLDCSFYFWDFWDVWNLGFWAVWDVWMLGFWDVWLIAYSIWHLAHSI